MADKKISELPAATEPLNDADLVEIVQGGVNKKAPKSAFGAGSVTSVTGTTDRITSTGGATPVIDIAAAYDAIVAAKAPIASPTFTGTPEAPTAAAGTNTTQLATTAFVRGEVVGTQDLFIPAAAIWPRLTGGCGLLTQYEMTTSLFNVQALPFDQTTQEFAQFQIRLPRKWNNGTVTVVPYWTAQSGTGTVQWAISGGAYSNDDALTVALGTAQTSDDTLISTNDLHIGPATSAITLAGTPADADFLAFQISRNPASDTLNADALLLGIVVILTTDAAVDA